MSDLYRLSPELFRGGSGNGGIFGNAKDSLSDQWGRFSAYRRGKKLGKLIRKAGDLRDQSGGIVLVDRATKCDTDGNPLDGSVFKLDAVNNLGSFVTLIGGVDQLHANFSPETIDGFTLDHLATTLKKELALAAKPD